MGDLYTELSFINTVIMSKLDVNVYRNTIDLLIPTTARQLSSLLQLNWIKQHPRTLMDIGFLAV